MIKANNLTSAAAFNLSDIEQQARALVSRAKAQADQVLADAARQAEALRAAAVKGVDAARAAAVEEGRQLGREQGIAQAGPQAKAQALAEEKAKLTAAVAGLNDAGAQFDAHLRAFEADAQPALLRLSLEIARRVVKVVSARDLVVLERNVADAVRLVVDKSSVRVAVAPQQLEHINSLLPQLKLTWPTLKHVEVTADPSVQPGGCRVYSANGNIDADIDRQLDRILSELLAGGESSAAPDRSGASHDAGPAAVEAAEEGAAS